MNRTQIHLVDEEVDFPSNEQLVSTTDLQGVITYANDHFCRVAGYSRAEMIGQHHNMVRHPDMPKAAFADLWGKLKQGKPWRGMVKNRCKDGRYYWVDAYVTPIFEQGRISGYQSVRNRAEPAMKAVAAATYGRLRAVERGDRKAGLSLRPVRPDRLRRLLRWRAWPARKTPPRLRSGSGPGSNAAAGARPGALPVARRPWKPQAGRP